MASFVTVFVVGFASVFLLGFQSRNVNHGNYGWAACTSFLISLSQAGIWTRITADDAGLPEFVAYGMSGSIGIVASMWAHSRFIQKAHLNKEI